MITHAQSPVSLQRMRISFIWHQNLMAESPVARPLVLDLARYPAMFNEKPRDRSGPLTLPWPDHDRQGFWQRYLKMPKGLGMVGGRDGTRAFVPLRVASPLPLAIELPDATVSNEGFLHPWGASFVVNVSLGGPGLDFAAASAAVRDVRSGLWFASGSARSLRLDQVWSLGLEAVSAHASTSFDGQSWDSFSVFTLLAARGSKEAFDPTPKDAMAARFLQAVTTFSSTWEEDDLTPLAQAKVAGKSKAPPTHLIYGSERRRAIWSPGHFRAPADPPRATLSCHHRNLVLASMQTEALGRYLTETARRLGENIELSGENRTQAKLASEILKRLHDGSDSTYRSGSVKAQMTPWLDEIDAVRAELGLSAIKPPPPAPPQPSP